MLLITIVSVLVSVSSAAQEADSPDAKELTRLEKVWNEAHIRGDADAIESLWADDSTITAPGMPPMKKAEAVGALRAGRIKFKRYETSDIRIRVYGNSAVVTGRLQRVREMGEREIQDDWRFTKVYIRT